jgi:hypothetical protein
VHRRREGWDGRERKREIEGTSQDTMVVEHLDLRGYSLLALLGEVSEKTRGHDSKRRREGLKEGEGEGDREMLAVAQVPE